MNEDAAKPISTHMNERITAELKNIEASKDVRVLYACESGSRAWGFASEDSDYDVRFIYVHEPEWYLRLEQARDVIEWKLNEALDINGWDLSKALRLMRASNPTIFEWLNSPIVYRELDAFSAPKELSGPSFAPRPTIYHYLNMARKNRVDHLSAERVRLKKYLRHALPVGRAVGRRATHGTSVPFAELVNAKLEPAMKPLFDELVQRKINIPESDLMPHVPELDIWIEHMYQEVEAAIPNVPSFDKPGWNAYDQVFLDVLGVSS